MKNKFNKMKTNKNNEGQIKKKQHKLWLNYEIENRSNFNKRDKEKNKKNKNQNEKKILEIIIKVLNWKQNFFF
jgi:hypothetical protein